MIASIRLLGLVFANEIMTFVIRWWVRKTDVMIYETYNKYNRDLYRGWEVTKINVCFHVLPNQIYKYLSAKIAAISCWESNI